MKSKVERLAVAGAIAPALRGSSARDRSRRVARVDSDGKIVGYVNLAKVKESILSRAKLEMSVDIGANGKDLLCERCGMPFKKDSLGRQRKYCKRCSVMSCAGCGKKQIKHPDRRKREYLCNACSVPVTYTPCKCGAAIHGPGRKRCGACIRSEFYAKRPPCIVCMAQSEPYRVRCAKHQTCACGKAISNRREPTTKCRACLPRRKAMTNNVTHKKGA